jgi:hypothetical protein
MDDTPYEIWRRTRALMEENTALKRTVLELGAANTRQVEVIEELTRQTARVAPAGHDFYGITGTREQPVEPGNSPHIPSQEG